MAAPIGNETLS